MSVKGIAQCMETLLAVHIELHEIGQLKVDPIKKGDMAALEVLVREETKLIRKLQVTEVLRSKEVKAFFIDKGGIKENVTMTDVKKDATDEECQQLDQLQDQLLYHMQKLKVQNNLNKQLIEESLRFVNLSLDLMIPDKEDISYGRPQKRDTDHGERSYSLFDSKA